MSGDYSPPPEQMPPPPVTQPPAHQPCEDAMPPSGTSLVDVDLKSILSSLPQLGGVETAAFLKADAGTDLSVNGDLAFASTASSPLVSFDAQVLGAAGDGPEHGDGGTGTLLGNLIAASADISTDLFGRESGNGGHEGCLCGEVVEPLVATVLDHVDNLLT